MAILLGASVGARSFGAGQGQGLLARQLHRVHVARVALRLGDELLVVTRTDHRPARALDDLRHDALLASGPGRDRPAACDTPSRPLPGGCAHLGEPLEVCCAEGWSAAVAIALEVAAPTLPDRPRVRRARRPRGGRDASARPAGPDGARVPRARARAPGPDRRAGRCDLG